MQSKGATAQSFLIARGASEAASAGAENEPKNWRESMRRVAAGHCLAISLVVGTSAAHAQDSANTAVDPYALVQDQPIAPEAASSRTTVTIDGGGVLTLYGQANLTFQSFDDGGETTSGIVDNGNWNTRLGATFSQPIQDVTLRLRFESGLGLRNSALISQNGKPDWVDWQRTSLRWFEVAVDTNYGTLSGGQGSSASDGTAGLDDSFTFHAGATDSSDGFGSFLFRDATGTLTNISVGQVNNSFDGARRFRIRYDTPDVHGVTLATSYGRNILVSSDDTDYYDAAIRWTGEFGDFAVRSAASYQWLDDPNGPNSERAAGSATVVHTPTGLNFAASAGQEIDGADYYWIRGGWRTALFTFGTTSLSADYYSGRDFVSNGSRTENFGLYAVQSFDAAPIDLYAGWRRFTFSDRSGRSYQDADGILIGVRAFF